jgi:hypothetical protein
MHRHRKKLGNQQSRSAPHKNGTPLPQTYRGPNHPRGLCPLFSLRTAEAAVWREVGAGQRQTPNFTVMEQKFSQWAASQSLERTPGTTEMTPFANAARHDQRLLAAAQQNLPHMNTVSRNSGQAERIGLVDPRHARALTQAL